MQAENLTGGQELLCINTKKVYDWVINDATFDITIASAENPEGVSCDDIESLSCEVVPDLENGIVELGREDREFMIDDETITLQLVTLRKNFAVNLFATLDNGTTVPISDNPFEFSRCEQVVLCAPEDTDIDVTYTDVDCFVCDFICDGDLSDIQITVRLCQSIQSTFEVTLEIVADFCQPREELPLGPCPAPTIPPQCPVVFPNSLGNGGE
ncbi:hypothetical protein [Oceanobacillus rekensis]|uniref:hypothetical protein n=1 Tax=Oceanobacillus rekensis TaxID=937927 RepID=UPI000B430D2C|nr:hypothetical protein [Oceanobacillus rekensis]